MKPITVKIDLLKIDKSRIEERTYTNKEGVEITEKNFSIDVVPLKQERIIKEDLTWKLCETHFVKETPTKEERTGKVSTKILGKGIMIMDKEGTQPF